MTIANAVASTRRSHNGPKYKLLHAPRGSAEHKRWIKEGYERARRMRVSSHLRCPRCWYLYRVMPASNVIDDETGRPICQECADDIERGHMKVGYSMLETGYRLGTGAPLWVSDETTEDRRGKRGRKGARLPVGAR